MQAHRPSSIVLIAAGGNAQPALPACAAGYTNDDTSPHTVSAYATCCRTAGR